MASTRRTNMSQDSPSQPYLVDHDIPIVASLDFPRWSTDSHSPNPRNLGDSNAAQQSHPAFIQTRPYTTSPGKITRTPPPPRHSASHEERPLSTRSASLPKLALHGATFASHSFVSDHQVSAPRLPIHPAPQSRRKSTSSISPVSPATSAPPPLPTLSQDLPRQSYYSLGSTPQSLNFQPRSPLPESARTSLGTSTSRRSFSATGGSPRDATSGAGASMLASTLPAGTQSKYDVKRMMSKPAPLSSPVGGSSISSPISDDTLLRSHSRDKAKSVKLSSSQKEPPTFPNVFGDVPPSPIYTLHQPIYRGRVTQVDETGLPSETDKIYFPTYPYAPPTRKSSLGPPSSNQSKTSLSTTSENPVPPLYAASSHVEAESPLAPRTLTPASAIAFAYQQSQLRRPSPSPNPSFSSFNSKRSAEASFASTDQSDTNGSTSEHGYSIVHPPSKPFASLNYKTSASRLIAIGNPSDSSHHVDKSSPTSARGDGALKSLRRKVSGKLRRNPKISDAEMFEHVLPSMSLTPPLPNQPHQTGIPVPLNSPATFNSGTSHEGGSGPGTPWLDQEIGREDDRGRLPSKAKQQVREPSEVRKNPAKLKKRASRGDVLIEDNNGCANPANVPTTPGGNGSSGMSFWKLVKKFSSSTLKEKHNSFDNAPPVPPVPKTIPPSRRSSMSDDYGIVQSTSNRLASGAMEDYTRSKRLNSHQDDGSQSSASFTATKGQPGSGSRTGSGRSRAGTASSSIYTHSSNGMHGGAVPAVPSRSPLHSRPSTIAASFLSSSPKSSSDMASSKFFARTNPGSPRTSTSSYITEPYDLDPPPIPTKSFLPQFIMPPSEIYQHLSRPYGGANTINLETDDSIILQHLSKDKRRTGQQDGSVPIPSSLGGTSSTLPTPTPSRISRKPSGVSEHAPICTPIRGQDLSGRSRSKSRDPESRPPTPPSGTKGKRTRKVSTLTLDNEVTTASSSAVSARYVAVQDEPLIPSYDGLSHTPGRFEISGHGTNGQTSDRKPKMARAKSRPDFSDTFNKESPVLFGPASTFYPNTPIGTDRTNPAKRRSRSQSPGTRWSIDDPQAKRESNGSAKRIPFTRAYSIDSPGARAAAAATSAAVAQVAFRELKAAAATPRKTDEEKARMWDMLMEKSEKAGGTLKASVDSSF